ncbi:hypothetical protein B0T16DRAFT_37781 [Cercophora newfieldiana]|uniref:Uncharacterized protein n=1 Tax=Cercophora newfieldiana TaxID=92897 RepID=A0AA39YRL7_9PEZI|nr:hypothetical protein B0T16DRAFT_37781 [Cercophora newfieldiana]
MSHLSPSHRPIREKNRKDTKAPRQVPDQQLVFWPLASELPTVPPFFRARRLPFPAHPVLPTSVHVLPALLPSSRPWRSKNSIARPGRHDDSSRDIPDGLVSPPDPAPGVCGIRSIRKGRKGASGRPAAHVGIRPGHNSGLPTNTSSYRSGFARLSDAAGAYSPHAHIHCIHRAGVAGLSRALIPSERDPGDLSPPFGISPRPASTKHTYLRHPGTALVGPIDKPDEPDEPDEPTTCHRRSALCPSLHRPRINYFHTLSLSSKVQAPLQIVSAFARPPPPPTLASRRPTNAARLLLHPPLLCCVDCTTAQLPSRFLASLSRPPPSAPKNYRAKGSPAKPPPLFVPLVGKKSPTRGRHLVALHSTSFSEPTFLSPILGIAGRYFFFLACGERLACDRRIRLSASREELELRDAAKGGQKIRRDPPSWSELF